MYLFIMALGLIGAITGLLSVLGVSGIVLPILGILIGGMFFTLIATSV